MSLTPYGNPVRVTTHWTIDKQVNGAGTHDFYLRVTNLDATPQVEIDEDELNIGSSGGPVYETGDLQAQVNGSAWDRIEIYIYVSITYGGNTVDDDKTWTVTLMP